MSSGSGRRSSRRRGQARAVLGDLEGAVRFVVQGGEVRPNRGGWGGEECGGVFRGGRGRGGVRRWEVVGVRRLGRRVIVEGRLRLGR